jgi:hypothetical protein
MLERGMSGPHSDHISDRTITGRSPAGWPVFWTGKKEEHIDDQAVHGLIFFWIDRTSKNEDQRKGVKEGLCLQGEW